jgi:hypothetical protein
MWYSSGLFTLIASTPLVVTRAKGLLKISVNLVKFALVDNPLNELLIETREC